MKKIISYFNPIEHIGEKNYSLIQPLIFSLLSAYILEFYAYNIAGDPESIGIYAIFIFLIQIIFFSFREGILAGFLTAFITIAYYFYIIYDRRYTDERLIVSIQTTILLAIIYFLIAWIIGWLKQTLDDRIIKESEEKNRLQAIIEQLPVGVIITNKKGEIQQTNQSVEKILGRKMQKSFVLGRDRIEELKYNGKTMEPDDSPLAESIKKNVPVTGREITINRKDDTEVYVSVNSSPIHNRENKIIAGVSIINDITKQKEIEDRKDDFINIASHELKTPLTSIKLYIESLSRRLKSHKNKKISDLIDKLKDQTDKLQILVSDLLDASRVQTGKLKFNKEVFDLNEMIEDTIEILKEAHNGHEIEFTRRGNMKVYADRFRIYQVLTNLLTNAIKYSPANKLITIKSYRHNGSAKVKVIDQGIGISKKELEKIFDRLYQAANSNQETFPGFGMGLFISKEIIVRHKGDIGVISDEGKGATFYFELPLH